MNNKWNTGDYFYCEEHPNKPFPHLDNPNCPGPGIPDIAGRVTILFLKKLLTECYHKIKCGCSGTRCICLVSNPDLVSIVNQVIGLIK